MGRGVCSSESVLIHSNVYVQIHMIEKGGEEVWFKLYSHGLSMLNRRVPIRLFFFVYYKIQAHLYM